MIEIISATRHSEESFWKQSALGKSIERLSFDLGVKPYITFNNTLALGEIYNRRINAQSSSDILVFVHDDVWIEDFFMPEHLLQGFEQYNIIGVAGSAKRVPLQAGWGLTLVDNKVVTAKTDVSGAVAHGKEPFGEVAYFGDVPASCELLDGVFLASKRSTRQKKLTLGTWHIAITHQSRGNFGSPECIAMYVAYIKKWKE
jgi:hypothetical protein